MKIELDLDTKRLMDKAQGLRRTAIPYALSTALTRTALDAKKDLQHEMKDVFDRPTPFVLNSIYTTPATVKTLYAEVWIKNMGTAGRRITNTLMPHIKGGPRNLKASEKAIAAVAAQQKQLGSVRFDMILSGQNYMAAGEGAKQDAYGNIPRGQYTAMLAGLRAFTKQGSDHNETTKSKKRKRKGATPKAAYFVGAPAAGRLPFGVWARYSFGMGSAIKPILINATRPHYENRFDFTFVVKLTRKRVFVAHFNRALTEVMKKIEGRGPKPTT